ncbi:MAG: hypothetical protein OEW73_16110 [Gammaproteobacteria bacterium]|nr:hypothetical protein [Gammaproteobacteria bacterium]MDH5242289.1 hypothetical protein [Gammaproteobacteria bacterium]MDH5263102.1 hypothetical protein [Gammaproteobacteria bacterium]MDH5583771.1 hypothetical protein [Gammaproteobacteria bacterium]
MGRILTATLLLSVLPATASTVEIADMLQVHIAIEGYANDLGNDSY